jgi:eukaryotic-like serine/threonine-protein kinase
VKCPDEEALLEFAAGTLSADRALTIERHLETCLDCCRVLGEGARSLTNEPGDDSEPLDVTPESPGRYELKRELGEGAEGRVFIAWDHHLAREVAIKVPHRDTVRPLREARLLARLDHPGIATIFEIGRRADGTLYSVHRFVRAERGPRSLREVFDKTTTLEERLRLLPRVLQACEAMGYAHGRGIVHRDLKPEHIALGDGGETVVLDWGLARALETEDAPGQSAVGTRGYWSPEQSRGEPAGPQADVFALGVILDELLAVVPADRRPRPLAAIAERARKEDPQLRYATAAELADDLTAWLSGGEVGAHAYALSERLALRFRRHRQALAFLCVIAMVAIGAAVQTARSRTRAQEALATSLLQKASLAQQRGGWDEAAVYSAAARELADSERARMSLGATAGRSRLLGRVRLSSEGPLTALALSHSGALLAVGVEGGDIALLAPGERAPGKRLQGAHRLLVSGLAFSPDDSLLYSTGSDGRLIEWNVASGTPRSLNQGESEVNQLAIGPRGDWLATVHEDGHVEVRALPSGELRIAWPAHGTPAYAIAVEPSGRWIATGAWSGEITLWNLEGAPLVRLEGHRRAVSALAVSPDGALLASASRDESVRVWQTAAASAPLLLEGHSQRVADVVWLDDAHLQSAGDDGQVRTWAVQRAETRATDWQCIGLEHLGQGVGTIVIAGEDTLIGGEDGALFRLAKPRVMTLRVPWRERVSHLDADDAGVVMIDTLSFVRRDLRTDEVIERESVDPVQPAQVRLLPGGRRFWAGYRAGKSTLFLRDAAGKDLPFAEVPRVWSLELDPDGRWGVALGGSRTLQLRSMVDGDAGITLGGHESDIFAAALGRTIAVTGSYDTTLGVFALPSGERTLTLRGHWHGVRSVDLSPDESRIASGSWDKTVRLWNAKTGAAEAVLRGHQSYVSAVSFSPSGRRLASASWDGALVVWDVATHTELLRQEHVENGPRIIEWFGEDVLRVGGTRMTRVDLAPRSVDGDRGVQFDGVDATRVDFGLPPLERAVAR